jgi:hypothetical protein
MTLVLADRVKDTTTTTGTGTITLSGSAPAGFQSFAVIGDGNTTYYTIAGGSQWEVGIGTYTASGTTLSRGIVLSSSNGGSLVDFSAGTKDVFVTLPSQRSYGIPFSTQTANYAASFNEGILADTSGGAFTVTLPASPVAGTQVIVADAANSWGTNNLTVARNGQTIEGAATDLICDITGVSVQLIYSGTTWQVFAQAGGAGGSVDINTQTTGTLLVSRGGTGATTLTANAVLIGNGTSAVSAVAPGTTGNVLTSNGTSWASSTPPSSAVNYPQNIQSADYTLVLADAGKQIFHPASDTATRTYTIPANSSVAFPIGTVVLFTVENGGRPVTVAINSDTLVFGNGVTGPIAVAASNTLTAIKITATKWLAYRAYQTGSPAPFAQSIAVAHSVTPRVSAYPWSSSGFGTKFADPGTLPPDTGRGVAFSPSGDAIVVAVSGTSPFIAAYQWNAFGFGGRFANPGTLPASSSSGVAFHPAGDAIAVAHVDSPNVTAYPWSGSGFGTKFADPATLPTGNGNGVAFSPSGDAIAVAHLTTPFISAYPWSGSGFGTKFADPATLPTGTGNGVAFSPSGDAIAVAHSTTPFISAYPWSSSGFGTKFADPATLPTGTGRSVAFSPAGDAIAVAHQTSPSVSAYPWSGSGFGTKFADPGTLPVGQGNGVVFSPAGDAIAVAHLTTPFISAYPWSGSGFGTRFSNPATLPTGSGNGVAFTVSGT